MHCLLIHVQVLALNYLAKNSIMVQPGSNVSLMTRCFTDIWDCFGFIIENAINTLPADYNGDIQLEFFRMMQISREENHTNEMNFNNVAQLLAINLIVWVFDGGKEYSQTFNHSISKANEQNYSFVIFHKQDGTFASVYEPGNDPQTKYSISSSDNAGFNKQLNDLHQVCDYLDNFQDVLNHLRKSLDKEPGL